MNPNIGTGYYGNITSNVQPTGLHICTLTDYYKTGEPALVGNLIAGDLGCTQPGGFDGQVVAYYKDGTIKRKEPWKTGKLNGAVVFFDENGNEQKREEYVNGKLLDDGKFAAASDSPLIGTWKYIEYSSPAKEYTMGTSVIKIPATISKVLIANFAQSGVLEITVQSAFLNNNPFIVNTEKTNWKYVAKTDTTGILEQYQGGDLMYRGNVTWVSPRQFDYVNTFNQNPNLVGQKLAYVRQ